VAPVTIQLAITPSLVCKLSNYPLCRLSNYPSPLCKLSSFSVNIKYTKKLHQQSTVCPNQQQSRYSFNLTEISDYDHCNGMNDGKTLSAQSSSFAVSTSGSSTSSTSSTSCNIWNYSIELQHNTIYFMQSISGCSVSVVVRASDWWSRGRKFGSRPVHCRVA